MHLRSSAGGSRRLFVRAGRTSVSTRLTVGSRRSASSSLTASSGGQRVLLEPARGRPGERFALKVSGFSRGSHAARAPQQLVDHAASRGARQHAAVGCASRRCRRARRRLVVRSGRTILALTFQVLPPVAPPPSVLPPPPPPMASTSPVLVGAGDIAGCNNPGDEATAALLDGIPGTVFTLGDNVYPSGTLAYFNACYEPSWGRHKARTRPVAGNHDYDPGNASGYFDYFGANAGERGKGYYSYDLGTWHVVVLDSDCTFVGGCRRGIRTGAVAARGPGGASGELHRRDDAPPALQLRRARQRDGDGAVLAGAVRGGRRPRARRPRPRLRALRADEPQRRRRPRLRHALLHRRHGRLQPLPVRRDLPAQQRTARRHRPTAS